MIIIFLCFSKLLKFSTLINYVSFTIIKLKEIITPCYSRDKNFNQILRRLKTYTAQYGHLLANDYEIVN